MLVCSELYLVSHKQLLVSPELYLTNGPEQLLDFQLLVFSSNKWNYGLKTPRCHNYAKFIKFDSPWSYNSEVQIIIK